ncbi:hypothetical protein FM042_01025 [Aliidiomarina halalkaliphila]|uniref:Uncharacterized protein n=1 Tax=Aliidiomarina halalkaliphila TaxID=2593535 RepID=A0A552X366_9GAMM|nr:pilus assembly protein N-terminal domain-containing protein [Aliidiomarina halalkaliphila]TRW49478.1 hypothetical protein FM042_01025 [Aliidiomarina halalkaliphila]
MRRSMLRTFRHLLWLSLTAGICNVHADQALSYLWLEVGQIHVESLPEPPSKIAIVAPNIVDVQFNDANEFVFLPSAIGQTDVAWWFSDGTISKRRVQVLPSGSLGLLDVLGMKAGASSDITAQWQQQSLMLEGRVDVDYFERLQGLKERYPFLDLSLLHVTEPSVEMLELEVYVVELSKRFIRNTGLAWDSTMQGPSLGVLADIFGSSQLRPNQDLFQSDSAQRGVYLGWAGSLQSTLQLLQERGEGKVLAKPRVRVESGKAADFLVGGELPIPQVNAQGLTDVTFKPYGIRLQVIPTLLASGWIRTELLSEVSQPDPSMSVQGIPGLRSRKATTQVTSSHNETAVIAGLISKDIFMGHSGLPTTRRTGKVSPLMQDESIQQVDTELVIFITARRLATYEQEQAELREAWLELRQRFATIGCQGMVENTAQGVR